jgi:hypothetical protein
LGLDNGCTQAEYVVRADNGFLGKSHVSPVNQKCRFASGGPVRLLPNPSKEEGMNNGFWPAASIPSDAQSGAHRSSPDIAESMFQSIDNSFFLSHHQRAGGS